MSAEEGSSSVLTNQSIIDLVAAEVPEAVIIGHIRASRTQVRSFDGRDYQAVEQRRAGGGDRSDAQSIRSRCNPAPRRPRPRRHRSHPLPRRERVPVLGGVPFEITLMEDVPNDPAEGLPLHFQAAKDYHVDGAVAIAKGAAVTGEVLAAGKKGLLGRAGKPMFRLIAVDAVDGTKLKVKSSPGRSSEKNERNIEPPGHRAKESLAPAGSAYLAYFDGDQTVAVKK